MGHRGFIIQHENLDAHQRKSVLDGNNKDPKAVISKKSKQMKIRRPMGDLLNEKQPSPALKLSPKKQQNVEEEEFDLPDFLCEGDDVPVLLHKDDEASQIPFLVYLLQLDNPEVDLDAEFEQKEMEMDMSEFSECNIRRAATHDDNSAVSNGRKRNKTNESTSTSRVAQRRKVNTRSQGV